MKTNKLFLGLFAGAFLCFSTVSYAQYHGGSSDGAFGAGTNVIDVGVGFASGFNNLYSGSTVLVSPAWELSYEHSLSSNWGIGLFVSDQSATSTITNSYLTYDANFNPVYVSYNYVYKSSLLVINARGAYHFTVNGSFDPYIGATLGYTSISSSFTTNDPNATGFSASTSYSGVDFGGFAGARYYFSSHIGLWAELQFAAASYKVGSYGGVSETVSLNPCPIANVGISFKF